MIELCLKTIISFLVIYGFISLVKEIFNAIFTPKGSYDDIVVVVKVLNSEESLEATVRMILWKCLKFTHGGFVPNILIVDMGSTDSTADIAKRLCSDYSFIEYTTSEKYDEAKNKR